MAKKSSFRFTFDSPVTIILSLVCALTFTLDTFVLNGKLLAFFICPASKTFGLLQSFNFASGADYLKIFLHVFISSDWISFFIGMILLLMFLISTVVNGVLTACLSSFPSCGLESVAFTLIFLSFINAVTKKLFPLSSIFILLTFICYDCAKLAAVSKDLQIIASVAIDAVSGLCASLIGYMVAPKRKTTKSPSPKEKTAYSKTASPFDETVVGEISL